MNNLMNYKGFTAKIEFSADDNVFVGRLIGIDDIVVFEAETVEGLNKAFQEAVDFHIEVCEKQEKKNKKSYSGELLFRLPDKLHAEITEAATRHGKSINEWGREVFETALKNEMAVKK
ncbi:MAG TPA: type II toxin-antitoxin system HicB family antitoxin [Pyrinomonadaceae bacterium]